MTIIYIRLKSDFTLMTLYTALRETRARDKISQKLPQRYYTVVRRDLKLWRHEPREDAKLLLSRNYICDNARDSNVKTVDLETSWEQ